MGDLPDDEDSRLFRDGYPHMVEILGLDEIPWALVPGFNAFATESDR